MSWLTILLYFPRPPCTRFPDSLGRPDSLGLHDCNELIHTRARRATPRAAQLWTARTPSPRHAQRSADPRAAGAEARGLGNGASDRLLEPVRQRGLGKVVAHLREGRGVPD